MEYWNKKGKSCTAETVKAALAKAKELDIAHVVLASSRGYTAEMFIDQGVFCKNFFHKVASCFSLELHLHFP
jgi:hypothetical protein